MRLINWIKEKYAIWCAVVALNDEFARGTGLPGCGITTEEAKDFIESGLTPREWFLRGIETYENNQKKNATDNS